MRTDKVRVYLFGTLSLILLLSGMGLFLYHNPTAAFTFGIFAAQITFYLLVSYALGIFSKGFNLEAHHDLVLTYLPIKDFPTVDVFYAICGEEFEVTSRALTHIMEMSNAYSGQCNVYICDDSKDGQGAHLVVAMFERGLVTKSNLSISRRPSLGEMKKAGNLKFAFDRTQGEFIAIFDADFCPAPNFLEETLPYFLKDPLVGLVQTPQYFQPDTHRTWVGQGAAYVQELFYRLIQVNRNHFGGSICVGTNAVYRRTSLEPLGGTAQVPYSEDVRTGFRVVASGWKLKYIPISVAKGLCPDNLPAYLLQQHRWALGSISLFFSKEFWVAPITFMQRLCFLSGMFYYITTGLALIFMYFPALYMLSFQPEDVVWWSLFFSLPSLVFGTMYQAYWGKLKWGFYAVMARQAAYYSHLFALVEYLTGNLTPWQPTGAASKTKIYERFQKMNFWVTSLFTFAIFGLVVYRVPEFGILPFVPTVFFTCYNYYVNMRLLRDQI